MMNNFDEQSFGVVPVYTDNASPLYLVIQQHQGHWGFPKGNPEGEENQKETALRELQEEVGVEEVTLVEGFESVNEYSYQKESEKIQKQTTYFLGLVNDTQTTPDGREVLACEWLPYAGAKKQLTFDESKQTLDAAKQYISQRQ